MLTVIEAIHRADIIHRDLKPGDVLLSAKANRSHLKRESAWAISASLTSVYVSIQIFACPVSEAGLIRKPI